MIMEDKKFDRKHRRSDNKKNRIKKILRYIGKKVTYVICVILVLIIITSCITLADAAIHPGKTPSIFGFKAMTVLTGSMEPQIKPGNLVIVRNKKDYNSIKVGDTVTYKNKENILITHRIAEINSKDGLKTYITKGDSNPIADVEAVTQTQLEGVYVTKVPYVGYIGMFVKSSAGIITLVIIPMLLIFVIEIKNHFKKSKVKPA
jgi:signal peptidase